MFLVSAGLVKSPPLALQRLSVSLLQRALSATSAGRRYRGSLTARSSLKPRRGPRSGGSVPQTPSVSRFSRHGHRSGTVSWTRDSSPLPPSSSSYTQSLLTPSSVTLPHCALLLSVLSTFCVYYSDSSFLFSFSPGSLFSVPLLLVARYCLFCLFGKQKLQR